MHEFAYPGQELELFQDAGVWKEYFSSFLRPYLQGSVLEVGAGIGSTTQHLCNGTQQKWLCLEPDPSLFRELQRKVERKMLPSCCWAAKGLVKDLPAEEKFNAIVYIDVIEHIEQDRQELQYAIEHLQPDGFLLVLVPAYQFVYSPFDKKIGHFRRYNKKTLRQAAPAGTELKRLFYLDSIGLLTSITNKYILKQEYPTKKQIDFWDKVLVRISKFSDLLIGYSAGKSLVAVWKKTG